MSQVPQTNFTTLNESEKKSKLWQLSRALGKCTLWKRGDKDRISFRIKEYLRDEDRLILHREPGVFSTTQDVLGSFELKGVNFFFKSKVLQVSEDEIVLTTTGEFYKSERRRNFRLLAYPLYEITANFVLPVGYEGGKVVDIRNKTNQTGLFKSFLKLVDPQASTEDQSKMRSRVQDLSVTGMSIHIGEVELEWFRAGEKMNNVEITLPNEILIIPTCKIVYVVDQIGHGDRQQKKYKVGLNFDDLPEKIELKLASSINGLLRTVDSNKDFEDFLE